MDYIDRLNHLEEYRKGFPEIKGVLLADGRFIPERAAFMTSFSSGLPIPFYVRAKGPTEKNFRWIMVTMIAVRKVPGEWCRFRGNGVEEITGQLCTVEIELGTSSSGSIAIVKAWSNLNE